MDLVGPVRPIRPEDIEKQKRDLLPNEVVEAFNETIAKHYHAGYSSFRQDEVVALMKSKGLKETEIFGQHYLDIEPLYEKRWEVERDSPGFNESYPATFTFKARRSVKFA